MYTYRTNKKIFFRQKAGDNLSIIQILDNKTADQIAAGEVIERPASVVKELVENSLDACASNITVELREGGLENIRITDDGWGMSADDLFLSVKRHATSKLRQIEDLDSLKTLGFRGEALPSIIVVSKTEIISRESTFPLGTKIILEGGIFIKTEPSGSPVGTSVNVSNLFYNTPARRKFMRSPSHEAGLIHELMTTFALGHPKVDFRLYNNGKEILNTKGINTTADLLESIYGPEARKVLLYKFIEKEDISIETFITAPEIQKSNRKGIHFFINDRRVISKELMSVIEQVYAQILPKSKFPLAVIYVHMPSDQIDVNIHPNKLEVRFKNITLAENLKDMLENMLETKTVIPNFSRQIQLSAQTYELFTDEKGMDIENNITAYNKTKYVGAPLYDDLNYHIHETFSNINIKDKKIPKLRIIGQLQNSFILTEGIEGLYLIDQHAAHERINYEHFLEQLKNNTLQSQILLIPITLDLNPLEEELAIQHIIPLADLGMILEHFGSGTYLLRAIPSCYKGDPKELFYSLLELLENKIGTISPADLRKEFIIMSSCRDSVKAGQYLAEEEIEKLIYDLNSCKNPLTCPHGRPTLILITLDNINREFQRK